MCVAKDNPENFAWRGATKIKKYIEGCIYKTYMKF